MQERIEQRVAREARQMTKQEVIVKAIEGRILWVQAADILGVSPRHMLRLKQRYETFGFDGLRDNRAGTPRRKRIPVATVRQLCELKRREQYQDWSVKHFYEKVVQPKGLKLSYTWARKVLQAAGLAEKAPARGKYRRKRERRPMVGMMLHLDASTHAWIAGLPMQDVMVMLDDADGRVLYARFFEQEGVLSTMAALRHVLERHGRFCELYTDRGSHFCRTDEAGHVPAEVQNGQVPRVLKALGIRQILAHSPQARGRSERAFKTIQGRLPQELKAAGIGTYEQANAYLEREFVPDFNRRFTIEPAQPESAFVPVAGLDFELLLSAQYERTVRNDSTVVLDGLVLQLPRTRERMHYVRCTVLVHEFIDGTLGVSYQGKILARYSRDGELITTNAKSKAKAA